jgi:hypothetical protein
MGGPTVSISIRDQEYYANLPEVKEDPDQVIGYYKIAAGPGHTVGEPIHENLTLAALIAAGCVDKSATFERVIGGRGIAVGQPAVWEFIRGVLWNDDPACELFVDRPDNNGLFAFGIDWFLNFKVNWKVFKSPIIRRSHYGDLQCLHAMGCKRDEEPEVTKRKVMLWLEVMYKLAVGKQGVSANDRLDARLGEFFTASTKPKGSETLQDLLLGTTREYKKVDFQRRALGCCFHIIQDSYAVGHCQRALLNPGDKVKVPFKFKPSILPRIFRPAGKPCDFDIVHSVHAC